MPGQPFIPYARQLIDDDDIAAVVQVLRSDWLTTGPKVEEFEQAVCAFTSAACGVAVSSGTAALHTAVNAAGIGPGDEVIVPALTFAATANCVVYQGGTPVFADVDAETLLIDPVDAEKKITPRTKAIIAVDYAGHPCNYGILQDLAEDKGLLLLADACHSLGGMYKGRKVGSLADMTIFSFHPVKHITTGEGGMVVANNEELGEKMRRFRNHGLNADHRQREKRGSWLYEMETLGYNYRLSDIQCALGISQLAKLPTWLARRREIAALYADGLADINGLSLLHTRKDIEHARHLFVVLLSDSAAREQTFTALRKAGIGVNVHYYPVHLHHYYQKNYNTGVGDCPVAEKAYHRVLSLPIHAGLSNDDVRRVIDSLHALTGSA